MRKTLALGSILFVLAGCGGGTGDPQSPYVQAFVFGSGEGSAAGQFHNPRGLAVAPDGTLLVADSDNRRVQRFTVSSTGLTYVSQFGSFGSGNGQFQSVRDVATDAAGNVYVVDGEAKRVQELTSAGAYVRDFGGPGAGDGQYSSPTGVAIDASGNVYVSDGSRNLVAKFGPTGTFIANIGSEGEGNGQFTGLAGVTISGTTLFAVDAPASRVEAFSLTGTYLRTIGDAAHLALPESVRADASGNLYVADPFGSVRKFSATGVSLGTVASENGASGVAVVSDGTVLVSYGATSRIVGYRPQ